MRTKTIEKKFKALEEDLKDGNSSKNQAIKGLFIERELYCNVNSLVEFVLNNQEGNDPPFSIDDIENFYSLPEWSGKVLGEDLYFGGGSEDDRNIFLEEFDRMNEESEELFAAGDISEVTHERNLKTISDSRDQVEALETEPAEIYEWYKVSGWLCEKLKEQGQPVISIDNIWGRTCTGQAVLLDGVITRICAGMGILEGQENEWSVK